MRNYFLILVTILFLLVSKTSNAQLFSELNSFRIYADSNTNYSSIWLDVDQDYDLDLLQFSILNKPTKLYIQQENALQYSPSVFGADGGNANGACYADIDLDGDLDVFVYSIFGQKNYLYIQESRGLFRKEQLQEITRQENNAFSACFSDVNLDNFPDLVITDTELWNPKSLKRPSRIYYNDGRGAFTKDKSLVFYVPKSDTRNILLADLNQDTREDLLLLNFGSENEFYLKNNSNTFDKTNTNLSNIAGDFNDAKAIDFDNDGDLDVLLVNLKTGLELYRNDGNLNFNKIPNVFNTQDFPIAGIEIIDYNDDGNMDVLLHKAFSNEKKIFINNNASYNYIKLKLRASRANANAIGAKVYLKTIVKGNKYSQYRELRANKQADISGLYELHFGIAEMKNVDSMKVIWPDGTMQNYTDLYANQTYFLEQRATAEILAKSQMSNQINQAIKDLSVSVVADHFSYGEIGGITAFYENKGLVQQDVELSITLSEPMKLFNSFPMPTTFTATTFTWKIKNVPAQYRGIVTLSVRTPSIEETTALEQKIAVHIEPTIGDENTGDNDVVVAKKIF